MIYGRPVVSLSDAARVVPQPDTLPLDIWKSRLNRSGTASAKLTSHA
jgi:hypothetical protein